MMWIYLLKANVALGVLYAFYRLFLEKDTFFGWRRTTLLGCFGLAALVPLFNIQSWLTTQESMMAAVQLYADAVLPVSDPAVASAVTVHWQQVIPTALQIIYGLGVLVLGIRLCLQTGSLVQLLRRSTAATLQGVRVRLLSRPYGPFSFFHWIFICPQIHDTEELNEILAHELTHVRQRHSADVLLSELVCIFCWFNPFAWLMRREIRNNLEYLADARVLAQGYNPKNYQYHLLGLSHQKAAATLYNNFNVLPLKKRIRMMNRKRTHSWGKMKYAFFFPLAALLLLISNIETVARTTRQLAAEMLQPSATADEEVTIKGKVIDKDGKPVQGVKIYADYQYMKEAIVTPADGSFDLKVSLQAILMISYTYEDGRKLAIAKRVKKISPEERANLIIVFDENVWGNKLHYTEHGTPEDPIYEVVEEMPHFSGGGIVEMKEFLAKNMRYPAAAKEKGIKGRVIVSFVVDKEGNITLPTLIKGVSPELNEEAIRLVKSMPKWEPGRQNGKPVRVRFIIPVEFRLN